MGNHHQTGGSLLIVGGARLCLGVEEVREFEAAGGQGEEALEEGEGRRVCRGGREVERGDRAKGKQGREGETREGQI